MDRKGIIAIALSLAVLLVWEIKFAPKFTPPPTPAAGNATSAIGSPSPAGSPAVATTPAGASTLSSAPSAAALTSTTAADQAVPEKIQPVSGPVARYDFTNLGGGIARTELLEYPAESGSNVRLNPFGALPIGAISDKSGENATLPYTVTAQGQSVVCERAQPDGLVISKKFNLPAGTGDANGYRLTLDITFTNKGDKPFQSTGYYLYAGSASAIHQKDLLTYTAFDWSQAGKATHIDLTWFNEARLPLVGIVMHPERPTYEQAGDKISWAAVNSQFFTTILTPLNGAAGSGVWAKRLQVGADTTTPKAIEGALQMPAFTIAAGQSVTQSFEIYAGPKIYNTLKQLNNGQEHILNFGFFSPVSVFLLNSMGWLHSKTGSYAVAIILLTLCIRAVLWPLQNKATASMRQMQELSPRINELKEKYADDPARMNQEVMKLYKEYNVNPLSGCLPMFVQIPIFFGFFRMLGTAIELRNSKFLWVHDLSQPDTAFHLGTFPVNILPICMAVTMLVQMSLTPKTGDKAQQRIFMFVPLIFITYCYNYASALALYWTVQNLFSIAQLYVTRSRTAPEPLKAKAAKRRTSR